MKIIISDLDPRMNNVNGKDIIDSINKFVRKGNLFIIATDKAINYIADTLAIADLNVEYYICNGGGVIFDKYFNILYRKDIKQSLVRPIINLLEDDDNILETFVDTSHGFVKDTTKSANGIVARPFDKLEAEVLLNKIVLKYPDIHGHVSDNWININDINVTKYNAFKYLYDNFRLDKYEVYVFGCDLTDLELVENYNGYTKFNCPEDLKTHSKGEFDSVKDLIDMIMEEEEKKELETIYESI